MMTGPPKDAPPLRSKSRILIVEDEAPVRELMAELLRRAGYDTETAPDAATALGLARLVRWDLVVLDIDLPDMSGLDLHEQLAEIYGGGGPPAVFVTGLPTAARAHRIKALAGILLAKPFGPPDLLGAVARSLELLAGEWSG